MLSKKENTLNNIILNYLKANQEMDVQLCNVQG